MYTFWKRIYYSEIIKKTFDNVDRQKLFQILETKLIPGKLLQAIVDIYTENKLTMNMNTEHSR
jgi:hypothetical protein